jgi:hypothetical protein
VNVGLGDRSGHVWLDSDSASVSRYDVLISA